MSTVWITFVIALSRVTGQLTKILNCIGPTAKITNPQDLGLGRVVMLPFLTWSRSASSAQTEFPRLIILDHFSAYLFQVDVPVLVLARR